MEGTPDLHCISSGWAFGFNGLSFSGERKFFSPSGTGIRAIPPLSG
jgi:hypothetical protein